jgi:hypothetical protein
MGEAGRRRHRGHAAALERADERAHKAYEYVEPIGFEIYGPAGEQIVEGMRAEAAGGGATLSLWPEFVTGFLRLASAG